MNRYAAAACAVILILSALIVLILLISSYFHFSYSAFHIGGSGFLVRLDHGVTMWSWFPESSWLPTFHEPVISSFYFLGFGFERRAGVGLSIPTIFVPHWVFVVLLCIYPVYWGRRTEFWLTRGRKRRAGGECVKCGYDLRGLAVGGRCPECGVVITVASEKSVSETV